MNNIGIYWFAPYHFHYGEDDVYHIARNAENCTHAQCGMPLVQMYGTTLRVPFSDICVLCFFYSADYLFPAGSELN